MVSYSLSEIEFDNDFYTISLEDGSLLVLNKINESLLVESTTTDIDVITVTHVYADDDENTVQKLCTNVIGMSDDYISISSDYTEYSGKQLNSENLQYCTIEVD